MRLVDTTWSSRSPGQTRSSQAGFTVLVVAIVIFVVSVVIALALPAVQRELRNSRARAVAADLRTFDRAFQHFASEHGDWPAGTPVPGAVPPGMEAALADTGWTRATSIGGRYVWLTNTYQHGERIRAAVAIVSVPGNPVSDDLRQLHALDRFMDDGKFRVGKLRLGYRDEPVFVLEH